MSHVSQYELKIKDIKTFVNTLNNSPYVEEVIVATDGEPLTVKQFRTNKIENCDVSFRLQGWRYSIGLVDEKLNYDHWGSNNVGLPKGVQNSQELLGLICQQYAIDSLQNAAMMNNKMLNSERMEDGSVKMVVNY